MGCDRGGGGIVRAALVVALLGVAVMVLIACLVARALKTLCMGMLLLVFLAIG